MKFTSNWIDRNEYYYQIPGSEPPYFVQRERPVIVCLCGSTRFMEAWQKANLDETLAGRIVLSVGCNTKSDADLQRMGQLTAEKKAELDELHKRKIDLSDEILVLNVGGYIGKSTRSEIDHAMNTGKRVRYLELESAAEPAAEHERRHGVGDVPTPAVVCPRCCCGYHNGEPLESCPSCGRRFELAAPDTVRIADGADVLAPRQVPQMAAEMDRRLPSPPKTERDLFIEHKNEYLTLGDLDKDFHRPECECETCEAWRVSKGRPTHAELRQAPATAAGDGEPRVTEPPVTES